VQQLPAYIPYRLEPMNTEELGFLRKKEARERNMYYKVYRILMLMSFIFPFAGAWYQAYEGAENVFSPFRYFFIVGILLGISSLAVFVSYRHNMRHLQKDIKQCTKTIETIHVVRKTYIANTKSYYFYIDSRVKLSIEVSEADFFRFGEGDEMNVEYATYSKEFLGYF